MQYKATTDWGIFLDINGVDALLHVLIFTEGKKTRLVTMKIKSEDNKD